MSDNLECQPKLDLSPSLIIVMFHLCLPLDENHQIRGFDPKNINLTMITLCPYRGKGTCNNEIVYNFYKINT